MSEPTKAMLFEVASATLADGAFVMVEPADGGPAELPIRIDIPYEGSHGRGLVLEASLELGFEILENMAESDGTTAPSEREALDALKEMTNMIAGALLPHVFEGDPAVKLGLPTLPLGGGPKASAECQVAFATDSGHALRVSFLQRG